MDIIKMWSLVPTPTPGTTLRNEDFGGMLAGGNLQIMSLNHEAVALWNLFDGKRNLKQIFDLLLAEYDEEDLIVSIQEYVDYCVQAGFLTLLPESFS